MSIFIGISHRNLKTYWDYKHLQIAKIQNMTTGKINYFLTVAFQRTLSLIIYKARKKMLLIAIV